MNTIEMALEELAERISASLAERIDQRIKEMESDDKAHHLLYRVLGVSREEGELIDRYQNTGRFLYRHIGTFLEESAIMCFEASKDDTQRKVRLKAVNGNRPRSFEVDCLVGNKAYEIKWRDASTDGDHVRKEQNRVKTIEAEGFIPIRIMFYEPNRKQAQAIQNNLQAVYAEVGGEYYSGSDAWQYLKQETGIDLLEILERIAAKKGL